MRTLAHCFCPVLTLLYLLAFLDRGNIGNARVAGMNKDLGLTGYAFVPHDQALGCLLKPAENSII